MCTATRGPTWTPSSTASIWRDPHATKSLRIPTTPAVVPIAAVALTTAVFDGQELADPASPLLAETTKSLLKDSEVAQKNVVIKFEGETVKTLNLANKA